MGERKISIRTSVLEEKATACNMLSCYADELKAGFYPYVEQACFLCSCPRSQMQKMTCIRQLGAGAGEIKVAQYIQSVRLSWTPEALGLMVV